jgi:4-hydroxy-3-polyprenylbenzoate decarboxylase
MKTMPSTKSPFIVAITGASGAVYGTTLLKRLKAIAKIETHLVISDAASKTLSHELELSPREVQKLADYTYSVHDIGATIASGSFKTIGMVIAPCSMRTLAAVAHGLCDNLISRSADVTLKERRKLLLLTRETPLNLAHIRNMASVTEMGGIIFPPVPAFYNHPKTIDNIVEQTIGRVLQLFGIVDENQITWDGKQ